MVAPRRIVPLPLLAAPFVALALLPAGTVAADAKKKQPEVKGYAVPCLKADGVTLQFVAKPTACTVSDSLSQEVSLVPVKRISWSAWTAKRAKGTGTVKGAGYSGKVTVTAAKPKRCSARRVIYTEIAVAIPKMGSIARLTAACPK